MGAGTLCETGTCNVIDRGGDDGLNTTDVDGKGVIQLAPKGVWGVRGVIGVKGVIGGSPDSKIRIWTI